jgi:N-acetylmuramic acid 6-phosphate (MurNAc-6-P) etherase
MVLNMISTGADHVSAARALTESGNRTPVAVVMLAANVNRPKALKALKASKGHVRLAIASARKQSK